MPTHSNEQRQHAFAVFESVLDLDKSQREAVLEKLRLEDPACHASVLALLRTDESAALNTGELRDAIQPAPPNLAGTLIDRYRLIEQVGAGGMGVVYRARREDAVEQQVAVKLVRQELRTAASLARFHVERQALARLEHPGIARLIDAGVNQDGRPWYVMEFVDGVPIDGYCRDQHLDLRQRVKLLVELCRIVESAHQALVVHRDIKPGNVLVTNAGQLKLIDFGIAKFVAADASDDGLMLAAGAGYTVHFASPEQVAGRAVTTVTDVYGIGALAFYLLTDNKLFAARATSGADYIRAVTTEEPEWPSRVAKLPQLRGDLDNILRKALAREPGARYTSAAALGRDLQNFLDHRPVEARAPSLLYRSQKFFRRNIAASVLGSLLLVSSAIGLVGYAAAAREVERQRDAAQTDARRAKEVSLFLTDMLTAADPRAGSEPTSLVSVVDRALQKTEQMLSVDPLVAATVLETIASVNSSLGRFEQALNANQRALDIYGAATGQDLQTVKLLGNRGELLQRAGRYAEAGPLLVQANNRIQELAPGSLDAALIEGQLGSQIMNSGGDAAEARARLASAVNALRSLEVVDERLAAVLNDYGVALAGENRWDEAIAAHEEAVEVTQRALGADHVVTNDMRSGLAGVLGMAGRFRAGADVHRAVWQSRRKVLGDENLDTLWSAVSLADYLMSSGQPAEAARLSRESLAGLTKLNGLDHPVTQFAWVTAARAACESGDARWGLEQAQGVYARRVATYGESHWLAANTASVLGRCQIFNREFAAAEKTLLSASTRLESARGADFVRTQDAFRNLADLYDRWNRPAQAAEWRARLTQ